MLCERITKKKKKKEYGKKNKSVPSHLLTPNPWAASNIWAVFLLYILLPPTHPFPLYLIQIIDERRCTRELERERDKERKRRTDYILHRAAPKAPTVLAPGAGQLMGRVKKRRVEYV